MATVLNIHQCQNMSRLRPWNSAKHVTKRPTRFLVVCRLVEQRLVRQAMELGLYNPKKGAGALRAPFRAIYAVGDNPASDIRGANRSGPPWVPVLVRSGVFQMLGKNDDQDPALIMADDVLEFVRSILPGHLQRGASQF